jgi:hypothetical protein
MLGGPHQRTPAPWARIALASAIRMNFNVIHIHSFFGHQRRLEFDFVAAPR